MDPELLQRFEPAEYFRGFLVEGIRPDGRTLRERRKARLQRSAFASAHGSSSVRLGESAAVAGVRAQVTEAVPELPPRGSIAVTLELPPLCSATFRDRNRSQALSTSLAAALTDILNSPQVFEPSQLDIREGEVFWVLHVHVVCLNFDGNAFDLCLLSALAALEDTLLPSLGDGESVKADEPGRLVAVSSDTVKPVFEGRQVKLLSRPLPVTFAQLPGDHWVLDPSAQEEELGASVSLCLVGSRWLVQHQGGTNTERFLGELMPLARSSVPDLNKLLDEASQAAPMED